MADNLKVGDVVRLKSGGPLMTIQTVADFYGEPQIQCAWFVVVGKNQKLEHGAFHPDTLIKGETGGGAIVV